MDTKIVYRNGKPYGVRNTNGYLFYFQEIPFFPGQQERYEKEVREQLAMAQCLVATLNAPLAPLQTTEAE